MSGSSEIPGTGARPYLAGASAMAAIFLGGIGFARFVPNDAMGGPLARMIEPFAPPAVILGLILAVLAWRFGARLVGAGLVALMLASGAELVLVHLRMSAPLAGAGSEPNLRVLVFNAATDNAVPAQQIVAMALAETPDIVVFIEAEAVRAARPDLQAAFPFVSACPAEACEILVAANRVPERFWQLSLNPIWEGRYAVLEFAPGQFLAINHLTKPWFAGISEPELAQLTAQYNWLPDSAVVVGDFNMPPWSRPMRALLRETGFRTMRAPMGTWPAQAAPLALPVDQVLQRGDVQVVAQRAFGAGLGSNHLGFVVDLWVPGLP